MPHQASGAVACLLGSVFALSPALGAEQIPNFAPNSNVGWIASGRASASILFSLRAVRVQSPTILPIRI